MQARGCRQGDAGKGVQARGVGQARNFNQRGCRLLLPEVQGMHARGIREAVMQTQSILNQPNVVKYHFAANGTCLLYLNPVFGSYHWYFKMLFCELVVVKSQP